MIINYFGGSTDPGTLNTWLAQNGGYIDHSVSWFAVATYATKVQHVPLTYQVGTSANDFVVDNYLCARVPVILRVTSPTGSSHFVVATGGESTSGGESTFLINDPGYNCTTLDQAGCSYNNQYQSIRKFSSGPAPLSGLEIDAGSPVELLVTAPNGQKTGFDPTTGKLVMQIASSDYYTESVGDDTGGNADTPPVKRIEICKPSTGQYALQVTGTGPGTFTLWFAGYENNGTPNIKTVVGVANAGSTATYNLQYSPTPGVPVSVVQKTTFQGTLADIANSLMLGLIDNAGIANSLSQKIEAAQGATGVARNNILNAFENEVNAQTGKHITGISPQVLLQDAASLISQNP